ncbi:MAG: GNAT family N-acetyltransferase [Treponema sp.]|jgi:ribosomal protein S18 acetylase RimI-like enzyme|nr:GNAT family N-acetyltransferase [Treponema sp.]
MELQLAKADDLDSIVKLFKRAIENMIKNGIFQWDAVYPNEDILKNDIQKNQMYKIIFDHDIVSAFVLNKECDEEYAGGIWEYNGGNFMVLHRLCVNTEYQNKGFGQRTMACIEEHLKNTGVESIRLDTFSKNQAALKLYNKLGYKKTGEANWRKGLFYLLEKKL